MITRSLPKHLRHQAAIMSVKSDSLSSKCKSLPFPLADHLLTSRPSLPLSDDLHRIRPAMIDFQHQQENILEEREINDDEIFLDSFYANDQDSKSVREVTGVDEPGYSPDHSLFAHHPVPSKFNLSRNFNKVRTMEEKKHKVQFIDEV